MYRIISHMAFMVQVIGLKKETFSEVNAHEDIMSCIISSPSSCITSVVINMMFYVISDSDGTMYFTDCLSFLQSMALAASRSWECMK